MPALAHPALVGLEQVQDAGPESVRAFLTALATAPGASSDVLSGSILAVVITAITAVLGASLGALLGWCGWRLAAREKRTALPRSWRPWLCVLTALAGLGVVVLTGPGWYWPAGIVLGAGVVVLGAVDLRHRLLPNRMTTLFGALAAVTLTVAALAQGEPARLLGALLGAAILLAVYALLAVVSRGGLGMGDVKLAPVLGAYGGWLGPSAWLGVAVAGFILGGLAAAVLLLGRRAGLRDRFAYGPAMLLGTLATVLLAG